MVGNRPIERYRRVDHRMSTPYEYQARWSSHSNVGETYSDIAVRVIIGFLAFVGAVALCGGFLILTVG